MATNRLFKTVARQIEELIDTGVYPPGARLPGERALAEQFGVSRVTVREAEIALEAAGRIEIRTRSGAFVRTHQPGRQLSAPPKASPFEVTEARLLIESAAAALAARHITDEAIADLDGLVDEMGSNDEQRVEAADKCFHLTIAEASNNPVMAHYIKSLWQLREENGDVKAAYEAVCHRDANTRIREHRAILDALATRKPREARAAMRNHFHRLIESMLDVTEERALERVRRQTRRSRIRFLSNAIPSESLV